MTVLYLHGTHLAISTKVMVLYLHGTHLAISTGPSSLVFQAMKTLLLISLETAQAVLEYRLA